MTKLDKNFWEKLSAIYERKDEGLSAYETELPMLETALGAIEVELAGEYEIIEPINRGGAGIIIKVRDIRLDVERALKLPRPLQTEMIESVRSELGHLVSLHHDNIIQVYTGGEVALGSAREGGYPYYVMELVEGGEDFDEALLNRAINCGGSRMPQVSEWLASAIGQVVIAMDYLHQHETLHFDIKPGNILIDSSGKPLITDLGFAKRKTTSRDETIVGFTLYYSHPDLRKQYRSLSSVNRVRKSICPDDFDYTWDVYALGKTILQLLSILEFRFPDLVQYDYSYVYLHLAACRMLDGKNLSHLEIERIRDEQSAEVSPPAAYWENWLSLTAEDFGSICYTSMSEISRDLVKLDRGRQFPDSVTELDTYGTKWAQTSLGAPAPFSRRVKSIVEHPCFTRLDAVRQLGFSDTIYAGATHTRFEHSLGAFRNCCAYVRALYNDAYNPLFRQLATDEDIKCVLVASLLHDLGQFPLAHEVEEVREAAPELKHELLTLKWLDNPTLNSNQQTLAHVIEDRETGWGVPVRRVKEVLDSRASARRPQGTLLKDGLKLSMLRSLVDGPLDVDKLDYLLRDSRNAFLPYGELVDVERLTRNLTIVVVNDDGANNLALGAYEKGQSAAESLTFARYLLYQALYWHHTVRAARAMLRRALQSAVKPTAVPRRKPFGKALEMLLGVEGVPAAIDRTDVIELIGTYLGPDEQHLVRMLISRCYYKRVLTLHHEPSRQHGKATVLQEFRAARKKPGFDQSLQDRIHGALEEQIARSKGPAESALSPEATHRVLELLERPAMLLTDCPSPQPGTDGSMLRFIPEPQRLLNNYSSRVDVGERVSEVWGEVHFMLMEIAAKGRVYVHPEARDTLMATLGPGLIRELVLDTVAEHK